MSHRREYSQGNIPFAWEAKPGVSKVANKLDYPSKGTVFLPLGNSELSKPTIPNEVSEDRNDLKIPLPPYLLRVPSRSASGKALKWQAASAEEDPFLLAFKVCTRTTSTTTTSGAASDLNSSASNKFVGQENKRGYVGLIGSKLRSKYFVFSCKNSCEVSEGNFVKLPPIPGDRIRLGR